LNKRKINLQVYKTPEELALAAADVFRTVHLSRKHRFYIIPGGTTPELLFSNLGEKIAEWDNTILVLSDERLVDHSSNLSNTRMVKNKLFAEISPGTRPSLLSSMRPDQSMNDKKEFLATITDDLKKAGNPDLAILGLGADGHTASLFPGDQNIISGSKELAYLVKKNTESFYRLSLSFSFLLRAKIIMFLISGRDKAEAVRNCLKGEYDPLQIPAQFLLHHHPGPISFFCDKAAASGLEGN